MKRAWHVAAFAVPVGVALALVYLAPAPTATVAPVSAQAQGGVGSGGGRGHGGGKSDGRGVMRGPTFNGDPDCGTSVKFSINGKRVWDKPLRDAAASLEFGQPVADSGHWRNEPVLSVGALLARYPESQKVILHGCGNRLAIFESSDFSDHDKPLYLVANGSKKLKLVKISGHREEQLLKVIDTVEIVTASTSGGDAG